MTPEPQVVTSGLSKVDPGFPERRTQFLAALEAVVLAEEFALRQAARARDVAGGKPGAGLRRLAGETRPGARVGDDVAVLPEHRQHRRLVGDGALVEQGGEMTMAMGMAAALGRPALGDPFHEAAVEDRDIMSAERLQHPPGPRRRVQRAVVVDDDAIAVADPQRLHPAGELVRRREHVRGRIVRIGDLVDVEEDRAGDVRRLIFRPRVAAGAGQEQGRVDHAQVGRAQLGCQPVGRNQRVHACS